MSDGSDAAPTGGGARHNDYRDVDVFEDALSTL